MRNLKKFLALVMAMVMAFSLMLTANAAYYTNKVDSFSDKDAVTEEFEEAVGVLTGMEIFKGDARGFAPADSITRAEVAALIYRAATGDVSDTRAEMYRTYAPFTDMNSGDWFAGYVGYCWNAGYIKGTTATTFNPYAKVTGYEVLAMILRAAGYDQNHEFEGSQWIVNVASLATQLHVVDDVKATVYGDTLYGPARRDVVASLLFRAIRPGTNEVNVVNYNPLTGYTPGTTAWGGVFEGNGPKEKTLGEIWFGMKETTGIIVGNQDTGEGVTRINRAIDDYPEWYGYLHQTYNDKGDGKNAETTASVEIDAKTGLDMFGHKVHAWYGNGGKTFWMEDKVVLSKLVTAGEDNSEAVLSVNGYNNDAKLGEAAQRAGFTVNLNSSKAVWNQSFGVSFTQDYSQNSAAVTADANLSQTMGDGDNDDVADDPTTENVVSYPLYLLISNDSDKKVNMIVALNAVVSKITKTDNVTAYPNVTVPDEAVTQSANDNFIHGDVNAVEVKALTGESVKSLGATVVGFAIKGTNVDDVKVPDYHDSVATAGVGKIPVVNGYLPAATSTVNTGATKNNWYNLRTPSKTVEGTVTEYQYNGTNHTGHIVIDGQKIERSLLADTVVNGLGIQTTAQLYGKYRAYLDNDGKYIYVEPIYDSAFVYGTYMDYQTPYASSSYEYTIVGVDLNGEQVKKVVKTVDGTRISSSTGYTTLVAIPKRDIQANGNLNQGDYTGYAVDADGNMLRAPADGSFNLSPRVFQANDGGGSGGAGIIDNRTANKLVITRTDARLGVKGTKTTTGTTASYDKSREANTYFTENTKFIVVDGAGTDTQTIKVYNGLTELLDGGATVTIDGDKLANTGNAYLLGTASTPAGKTLAEQMYYTMSDYVYASVQNNTQGYQVDTIILPKAALSWTGRTGLYYVGNPARTSEIQMPDGTTYYQYNMYLDGEKQSVWLLSTSATVKDTFYRLVDTGRTLPNGTSVYDLGTVTSGFNASGYPNTQDVTNPVDPIIGNLTGGSTWGARYNATSYADQTATLQYYDGTNWYTSRYKVAGAKVVNLNAANSPGAAGYAWPNIADLGTLNEAGSLSDVAAAWTAKPRVSCVVDSNDPLTITVIYVCWDQNNT